MWVNLDAKELELIKATLSFAGPLPAFADLANKLTQWEKDARSPLHKHFNDVAFETYENEGEWEIDRQSDGTAAISISEDGGAYVMAWRWVDNDEADICTECGDHPDSATYGTVGDGYDGMCPDCADKADQQLHPENYE